MTASAVLRAAPAPIWRLPSRPRSSCPPWSGYSARREEQAAHDERRFASDLQHAFLPGRRNWRRWRGIDLAVGYVPAMDRAQLGGDFHAAFAVERGVLLLGDVAGHSLAAATVIGWSCVTSCAPTRWRAMNRIASRS